MKLLQLIEELQGFADVSDDPKEIVVFISTGRGNRFAILSVYEGEPGDIWLDVEEE